MDRFEPQEILDSVVDGIFAVNPQWEIISFNAAAEKLTGFRREEALGRHCWEVFRSSICDRDCALRGTMRSGDAVPHKTIFMMDSEGNRHPISISTSVLKNQEGTVIGAVETFRDLSRHLELASPKAACQDNAKLVGESAQMKRIRESLPLIAASDSPVLVEGEPGTGKEMVARLIHTLSAFQEGRFIPLRPSGLPESLLETDWFGEPLNSGKRISSRKKGKLEVSDGGTVFIDGLEELPSSIQVRMLRLVEHRLIDLAGAQDPLSAKARLIAATCRDPAELVKEGLLKKDLYYRLNVIRLKLPPLRERKEDIPFLLEHFLECHNRREKKSITGFAAEVRSRLLQYDFPGNVVELRNVLEQTFFLCRSGIVQMHHIPRHIRELQPDSSEKEKQLPLKNWEKRVILETIEKCSGNKTAAAKELGIEPSTLFRKLRAWKKET